MATTIADSLVERELLCELLGAMASVLERNISVEFARDFKARAMSNTDALAQLVARQLPWLPREFTEFFAEGALTLTAGMYPFSVPDRAGPGCHVRDGLSRCGPAVQRWATRRADDVVDWSGGANRSVTTGALTEDEFEAEKRRILDS